MKPKLIILLLLFSTATFACQCFEFNKENIKELKKEVDYIIIGTVVNNINLNNNDFINSYWEKHNRYQEVIVKVERIIKGKLKSNYLYISQVDAGNCTRYFEKGKKYIFTGHKIKKFINLTPFDPENEISNYTRYFLLKLTVPGPQTMSIKIKECTFLILNMILKTGINLLKRKI